MNIKKIIIKDILLNRIAIVISAAVSVFVVFGEDFSPLVFMYLSITNSTSSISFIIEALMIVDTFLFFSIYYLTFKLIDCDAFGINKLAKEISEHGFFNVKNKLKWFPLIVLLFFILL